MFAPTGKWTGSRVRGNGLWVNCWGRDRRHFNSSMEANCEGSAKYCLANIGDETCK